MRDLAEDADGWIGAIDLGRRRFVGISGTGQDAPPFSGV